MASISIVRFGNLITTRALPARQKIDLPIVFIHGAMGGRWQFKNWQEYCSARGWESYALDLRGHHDSPCRDLGQASLEDYAKDVECVMEEIGPCYLAGHSMGGLVAQLISARNPKAKKAVFIASAPPAHILFLNRFLLVMLKYLPKFLSRKPILLNKRDATEFLLDRIAPDIYALLVPESGRACLDMAFQKVGAIPCPTLTLAGHLDRLIPPAIQKKIARKYNSEYIELDMGHMIPLEKEWEQPIEVILRWLER